MSVGTSVSSTLTPSAWRYRLAVGVTVARGGWRWQPVSGTYWPPDAMRRSESSTIGLRT